MDAYTSNYFTHGTLETLKKFYWLKLIKQQERENKTQQRTFHITFDISMFTKIDKNFRKIINFEHTQTQFEQLERLLLKTRHYYTTSNSEVGKIRAELKATAVI